MRVLHIIHSVDLKSGGPSHALFSLVKSQVKLGLEPHIFCTDRQASAHWEPRDSFLSQVQSLLPDEIGSLTMLPAIGKKRPWLRYGFSFQCNSSLRSFMEAPATRPAFVHIHGLFSQITSVAARLSLEKNIPHAIRLTGALDDVPLSLGNSFLKKCHVRLSTVPALKRASFVHTTSESEAETASKYVPRNQVRIIPLGIEIPTIDISEATSAFQESFPQLKNKPFLLCLSRIHPKKNLELTIKAFHCFAESHPDTHLVIAGEHNSYQEKLARLARDLGVEEKVHFVGFLKQSLKSGALFSASCFLQTSFHENFGISILESMAHGLKAVATPGVASAKYLKPADAGMISEEKPEALAEAVHQVMARGDSSRNESVQSWVQKNMSWDSIAKILEGVYSEYSNAC
jgi:glycosyltransferase involved in cell wall biosynthesis